MLRTSVFKSLATAASTAFRSLGVRSLKVGEKAPLFEAVSTCGVVTLADYLGTKHVVLAFYYADFTPT